MSDVQSQGVEPVRVTCVMTSFGVGNQCFLAPEGQPDMRDVLLWRTTLYRSGFTETPTTGARLDCLVEDKGKGPRVLKVLAVEQPTVKKTSVEGPASVKFFLIDRGYGIATFDDGNDAFVHKTRLKELGIDPTSLRQGKRFNVKADIGPKGLKVVEL